MLTFNSKKINSKIQRKKDKINPIEFCCVTRIKSDKEMKRNLK